MILIADLQTAVPFPPAKFKRLARGVIASAVITLTVSSCVRDELWGSLYEADLIHPEDPRVGRFSLMLNNAPVPMFRSQGLDERITTYLKVAMPFGSLDQAMLIDGDLVKAKFGHSTGARMCEESHGVHGTVTVRRRDHRGVVAWLDVVATCPRDGD